MWRGPKWKKLVKINIYFTTILIDLSVSLRLSTACEEVQTTGCIDIVKQNLTIIPNPFGFGDTADEVVAVHSSYEPLVNTNCHADGERVLCSLLNPECPDILSQEIPVVSLFEYDLPCRSLCLEVGAVCFDGITDGDSTLTPLVQFWEEMCDTLPESAESAICFLSSEKTDTVTGEILTPAPLSKNAVSAFKVSYKLLSFTLTKSSRNQQMINALL